MEPVKVITATLALILLVCTVSAYSQWDVEYTTTDIGIFSFGTGLGNTYAGTGTDGKIYYDDGGAGWTLAYDSSARTVRAIQEWGEYVYFGTDEDGIIYRTNGTSLDTANNTAETSIYCFETFGSSLYAGTGNSAKVLTTSDGLVWNDASDLTDDVVYCLKNYKGYLYAGTGPNGILYRTANGTVFSSFNNFAEDYVYSLEIFDGYLYISTGGGSGDANIYRTDGTTVELVYAVSGHLNIYDLQEHDGVLYASTDNGAIYRSYGGGWELDYETLTSYVYALGSTEYYIYAGGYQPGQIFSLYRNATAEGWGYTYPPHTVKMKVVTGFGSPLTDATITATPVETTMGSWSWLSDLFGIDNSEVNIAGTTLTGTTDNTGSASFLMVESIQYRVNITHTDIDDYSTLIYPQESLYLIFVETHDWFTGGEDVNSVITMNVTTAAINATYQGITITGNASDDSGFTGGTVYLNQTNTTVPNGPDTMIASYSIPSGLNFSHTFNVTDYSGDSYFVRVNATHTDFATYERDFGVTFPMDEVNPLGLDDFQLMWIAMITLLICGSIFTATTAHQGPLLTCFLGWILFSLGWFSLIGTAQAVALLTAATVFSVIIVVAARRDAK